MTSSENMRKYNKLLRAYIINWPYAKALKNRLFSSGNQAVWQTGNGSRELFIRFPVSRILERVDTGIEMKFNDQT